MLPASGRPSRCEPAALPTQLPSSMMKASGFPSIPVPDHVWRPRADPVPQPVSQRTCRRVGRGGEREPHALQTDLGGVERDVHVRGGDRRGWLGVDDRAFGAAQLDRGEDAVVVRKVAGDDAGEHRDHLAFDDVGLRVEEVVRLW